MMWRADEESAKRESDCWVMESTPFWRQRNATSMSSLPNGPKLCALGSTQPCQLGVGQSANATPAKETAPRRIRLFQLPSNRKPDKPKNIRIPKP